MMLYRSWRRILPAVLAMALALSAVTYTQSQAPAPAAAAPPNQTASPSTPAQPLFRSSIQFVEVDVRVSDNKGVPVHGLKKEDFKLVEDGVEQAIDAFTAVDVPVATAVPATAINTTDVSPDVATNEGHTGIEGRLFVILLDDRQIAPIRTQNTIRVVKQFIDRNIGPKDMAAVVTSSGRVDVSQSFTNNKRALSTAVEKFIGRKLESLAIQRLQERLFIDPVTEPQLLQPGQQAPATDNDVLIVAEHFQEARAALQAFRSVCDWLGGIKGVNKSLILVSEGVDYDYESDAVHDRWAPEIIHEQRLAIAAATRANVTVYPLDPRGLGQDDAIVAGTSFRGQGTTDLTQSTSFPVSIETALREEIDRARSSMREMAVSTGGIEFLGTNDFEKAFGKIVEHSSSYYLLGYHPKNNRREGKFRTIKVTVNRSGTVISARRGYGEPDPAAKPAASVFAPPPGASAAVSEALNNPLPINEMTLSTTAVAFRGANAAGATVAVIVETPSLTFTPKDGKLVGNVEVVTAAVNDRNTIAAGQTRQVNFNLTAQTSQQVQSGFRALDELTDLKPGRYELRIAFADKETAKRGSVGYTFEVPDFSSGKLAMTNLLVASLAESRTPTINPAKTLGDVIPLSPTTVRQFHAGDELTVVAEVYDNELTSEHQVDLTTTMKAADGTEVFSSSDWASFEELTSAKGAYRASIWIPLTDIAPGNYTISIAAQRKVDDQLDKPISRTIPVKIVK